GLLGPTAGGGAAPVNFGIDPGVPGVTVRDMNRTFVNLGFGREWYLDPANTCGLRWRAGFDVGGRYGVNNVEFQEIRHRTDTIGGLYAALHTDVECPCGGLAFLLG